MTEPGANVLSYPPSGHQLDFVRAALPPPAEGDPAPHVAALHTWIVKQPPSTSSNSDQASDTEPPSLHIALERWNQDCSPASPSVAVLRLPGIAWGYPAMLRDCTSPWHDSLTVNGRPFLTALRALCMLSPYCQRCVGRTVSSALEPELSSSAATEEEHEAAAEQLWAAVEANAAEHGQPPEEVLLLMLALNAASLAGTPGDLGHLPPWHAYIRGSVNRRERAELPRELQHALALLGAAAMQAVQLACGAGCGPSTPAWDSPAGRLRMAALQALELRPQVAVGAKWPYVNRDFVEDLLRDSGLPAAAQKLAVCWRHARLPRAALRALGAAMAYRFPAYAAGAGLALAESALQELPQAPGTFRMQGGALASELVPGGAPQHGADPAPGEGGHASTQQGCAPQAAEEGWRTPADVGDVGDGLRMMLWATGPSATATRAHDLDAIASHVYPYGHAQALEAPASTALGSAAADGVSSAAADRRGEIQPRNPDQAADACGTGVGAQRCGSAAAKAGADSSVARAWPPRRVQIAARLLACAVRCLQAVPLQLAQNPHTPGNTLNSTSQQPARVDESADAPAAELPPKQQPAADTAVPAAPPSGGAALLKVPSQLAQGAARLSDTLTQVLAVLKLVLEEPSWLPAGQPALLGALLAPILLESGPQSESLLPLLKQLYPARPQVWNGLRAGLLACGRFSLLDVLHALLLPGNHALSASPASESQLPCLRVLIDARQRLLLLIAALGYLEPDSHMSGHDWAPAVRTAQPAAVQGVLGFLWQVLQWAVLAHRSGWIDDYYNTSARVAGSMALAAMHALSGLLCCSLPPPVAESVQLLMAYLAIVTKSPELLPPVDTTDTLENALGLVHLMTARQDIAEAAVAAQGVPRLLYALPLAHRPRGAMVGCLALFELCQRGPGSTLDMLVACRGVQVLVCRVLLPPAGLTPATVARPPSELQRGLRHDWLIMLRSICPILQELLGVRLVAAQQFWTTAQVDLPATLTHLAAAQQAGDDVDGAVKALFVWVSCNEAVLALRGCNSLIGPTTMMDAFLDAGFGAFVYNIAESRLDAKQSGGSTTASVRPPVIEGPDCEIHHLKTGSVEEQLMLDYAMARAGQQLRETAVSAAEAQLAAEVAMVALLQEEEEQLRHRKLAASGATVKKRRKKGTGTAAANSKSAGALRAPLPAAAAASAALPRDKSHGEAGQSMGTADHPPARQGKTPASAVVAAAGTAGVDSAPAPTADARLPQAAATPSGTGTADSRPASGAPAASPADGAERHAPDSAAASGIAGVASSGSRQRCCEGGAAELADCDASAGQGGPALDMQELLRALLPSPAPLPPEPDPSWQQLRGLQDSGPPQAPTATAAAACPSTAVAGRPASTRPDSNVASAPATSSPAEGSRAAGTRSSEAGPASHAAAEAGREQSSALGSGSTCASSAGSAGKLHSSHEMDDLICCPISQEPMMDPIICADGHT